MCMYVNGGAKIRRAFRRITCWKILEWDNENCIWTGPFYKYDSYVEGKMLKSDERIGLLCGMVRHGLHTYADESVTRIKLRYWNKHHIGEYRLVKCKIPMFSRFIKGIGEDGMSCYVSEKLKVVKFV